MKSLTDRSGYGVAALAALLVAGLVMWLGLAPMAAAGPKMMHKTFLDPQMSWPYQPEKLAGKEGKFYINGQNEGYVTVYDAKTRRKLKVINFWEYEKNLMRQAGKSISDKDDDFIKKNKRPHHSWVVPGGRYNYVSNNAKKSDSFWVVDTYTDKIVAHFNTGGMGPLHGAFSPFRDLAVWGNVQDKKKGLATFIDTSRHKVIGKVRTTGTRTRDVVFTPDNKHVYITNSGWDPKKGNKGGVDMINIETMKVVKTFPVVGSKGMKMTYDGKIAGVTGFRVGQVTFIDAVNHKIMGTVKVGGKPNNISFNWSNTKAYVGLYGEDAFAVIDMKTMKLKTKIPAGKKANAVYFPPGNNKIAIGTSEDDDFVTFIDVVNDKVITTVDTPLGAHNVAFTPDGKTAFVSCKKSREAVFLDVDKMEEIEVVDKAGHGNNGVRWIPYGPGMSSAKPYRSS